MPEQATQEEKRYAYRLPPCPAYDVEGIESWLCAMAAKGLVLTKDGRFMGFGIFEKTAPCSLRYRLEASPKQIAPLDTPSPTEEAEDIYAAYGWEYVGAWGQFFVYCTDRADARELNTDSKVQAIALRQVRKRELSNLLRMVFWLAIIILLNFRSGVVTVIFTMPDLLFCLTALLVVWASASSVAQVVHLRKLAKRLAGGEPLDHKKDWHKRALRYRLSKLLFPVLAVAWLAALLNFWGRNMQDLDRVPLSEYTASLPFPSMAELLPECTVRADERWDWSPNAVTVRSNMFMKAMIEYSEAVYVDLPDGTTTVHMYVDYFETLPILARQVARDRQHAAKSRNSNYAVLELPAMEGFDYAVGYMDLFPTAVLQKGGTVLRVQFVHNAPDGLSNDMLFTRLAEAIG